MNIRKLKRNMRLWRPQLIYLLSDKETEVRELLKEQVAQKYLLKKYVEPYYEKHKAEIIDGEQKIYKTCWIYWRQGLEKAPDIVKICVSSIKKAFQKIGWDINILDIDAVKRLCDFPEYIWLKYEQGIIPEAQFSDLVRLQLLVNYGGCWVDSTVLIKESDDLESLFKEQLFVFRNLGANKEYINISNWMIYSQKNNNIVKDVRDILFEYWRKENVLLEYYLFHIVFKLVSDRYGSVWEKLPTYNNTAPHILQGEMFSKYSQSKMDAIDKQTFIHKLYWKVPKKVAKGTFYEAIMSNQIRR